jgi:hypothetical protein
MVDSERRNMGKRARLARRFNPLAVDARDCAYPGGINATVAVAVVGTPTGVVYGHNQYPGPLDGKPQMLWDIEVRGARGSIIRLADIRALPEFK